jgi:hypothetical protein
MDRAECRTQDAEFYGPQILGAGYFVTTVGRDEEVIGPTSETKNWPIGNWSNLS